MIKYNGILINEVFKDDEIVYYLFLANIYTMEDLSKNIINLDSIRTFDNKTKKYIYNKINDFLNGKIIVNRTKINDNIKNVFINELGFDKNILKAFNVYNINTIEDLHYVIDRDLLSTLQFLIPFKDIIIKKYNSIVNNTMSINRIFSNMMLKKIDINKDRKLEEFEEFMPVIQSAFKYVGIKTIGELAYCLLSDNLRGINMMYKSLLISDIKTILSKLELSEEIHK